MISKLELFDSINKHLLEDETPSEYLNQIIDLPVFREYPYIMLHRMKETDQSPVHHAEGNVWNHTLMVVDEAAKIKNESKDVNVFMMAALLHDIGKPGTTRIRKGKITAYDHEKTGSKLTEKFLQFFLLDDEFKEKVASLVRWHMQILFVVKDLPFAEVKAMREQVDINEVALLGLCDRLGRLNPDFDKEKRNIEIFISKCKEKA